MNETDRRKPEPATPRRILRPRPLAVGDTVGLAAPAGPAEEAKVRAGIRVLEDMGLKCRVPPEVFEKKGFLAGTDRTRARVLRDLLLDPEIRAIFCTRGGSGSLRLLPLLGLDRLPGPPKILVGFSDLTALLLAVHHVAGWVPFHGPVVASFASADQATSAHLADLLFGRKVFPLSLDQGHGVQVLVPGRAEGPLMGGNLTLLVHLIATPFRPNLEGAILFLEDAHEAPYRLDRMLTTLRLAGILDRLAGLVLGHFEDCGPPDEVRRVLEMNLADFPGPVVADFPIGHGTRNLTLPIGPRALLDTQAQVLDLLEPCLAESSV